MDDETAQRRRRGSDDEKGMARLLAFSDGVFAIATTLLVFSLRVPLSTQPEREGAAEALLAVLSDRIVSYIVSFSVIALFWVGHHRKFRHVARYDEGLLWLNLLFLFFIVLLPFTTELLGQFASDRTAVSIYGASLTAAAVTSTILWWYVAHDRRLLVADVDAETIRRGYVYGWILIVAFALSALAAFLDVRLATVLWIAPLPVTILSELHRHRHVTKRGA